MHSEPVAAMFRGSLSTGHAYKALRDTPGAVNSLVSFPYRGIYVSEAWADRGDARRF